MKTSFTLSALVAATLAVCGGCTDPETMAKHSAAETPEVDRAVAPRNIAVDSEGRSPAGDRDADPSETGKRPESKKLTGSNSPLVGNRDNRERSIPDVKPTVPRDSAGLRPLAGMDNASGDLKSKSEETEPAVKEPPKKEYKFEFVSSSGKEGLEPGDAIPEITGRDLDNIKFNLTDYEGKVVMLDFWGDW